MVVTALRLAYGVGVAREVHTLDLYTKSNMFSLTYRRKFSILNLIQIDFQEPVRETRQNRLPVVIIYIPINDTVRKSPVQFAREIWNNQHPVFHSVEDHEHFKTIVHCKMNNEYIASGRARLGLFY